MHVSRATPTLPSRSPRPEDARLAFLEAQLDNVISERNVARKEAEIAKEEKNLALREIKQQYIQEKRDWAELCDTVRVFIFSMVSLEETFFFSCKRYMIFLAFELSSKWTRNDYGCSLIMNSQLVN